MNPPGITRHRRPFLAPLWLTLLAVLIAAGIAYTAWRGATSSMVVLVSVGEKDPGTIDDPPISAEGEQRAQRLAQLFAGSAGPGRLDALYVSSERRAQQTAAPLAERLHLTPNVFAVQEAGGSVTRLLRSREGSAALVVAGGTAVQQLLRQLAGAASPADAVSEPDLLYIVSLPSVGHPHVLRLRY